MIKLPFGDFSTNANVKVTYIPYPYLGTVAPRVVTGQLAGTREAMGQTYMIVKHSNGKVLLEINVRDVQSVVAA